MDKAEAIKMMVDGKSCVIGGHIVKYENGHFVMTVEGRDEFININTKPGIGWELYGGADYVKVKRYHLMHYVKNVMLSNMTVSDLLECNHSPLFHISDYVDNLSTGMLIKDRSGGGLIPYCEKYIDLTPIKEK